jgi:hypothetical protein
MNYVAFERKSGFDDSENEEIWKIFEFKNTIYFQSFNAIYKYDGSSIKKLKYHFLFLIVIPLTMKF